MLFIVNVTSHPRLFLLVRTDGIVRKQYVEYDLYVLELIKSSLAAAGETSITASESDGTRTTP